MSLSDTTSRVISLKRDCAASITARRSFNLPRLSPVVCAWFRAPRRAAPRPESSRSATNRARSVCRDPSDFDIPPMRPESSALDCASAAKRASIASCRSSAISRSRRRALPARQRAIKLTVASTPRSDKAAPSASEKEIGTPAMRVIGPEVICASPTPSVSWPPPDCDPGVSRPSTSQPLARLEDQQASSNTRRDLIRHPSAQSHRAEPRGWPGQAPITVRGRPRRAAFSELAKNKIRTRLTAFVQPIQLPRSSDGARQTCQRLSFFKAILTALISTATWLRQRDA